MHNIDRTNVESTYGEYPGEAEQSGFEFEFESEEESVFGGEQGLFSEAEEMELAAQLLSASNEAELEQFLGDIFKKAAQTFKKVIRIPLVRSLGGPLKDVIRKTLPMVGAAAGNILAPGVGGVVGGGLASAAGRMFGLELEALSPEDQEFEVAKGIVRLAGAAASNAAQAAPSTPLQHIVQSALTAAAQQHAPGLLRGAKAQIAARPNGRGLRKNTGRWMRRGNAIILIGA
jgi:hypothetical protein